MSITPGAIRFNTDSMKLEYYRGGPVGFGTTTTTGEWVQITTDSPDIQTGGARGVFGGGYASPSNKTEIDYITISTTGNAISFGDLNTGGSFRTGASSSTRGIFFNAQNTTGIEYITISSTGDGISFGSATNDYNQCASCSNQTRGLRVGGSDAGVTYSNIYYVTIASTGTYGSFGNLSPTGRLSFSGVSSPVRGVFAGGRNSPNFTSGSNIIDFVTLSTLGNSADFGDLTYSVYYTSAAGNSVKGVFAGGTDGTNSKDTMNYITISTLGNAVDFGNLSVASTGIQCGNASSPTRGIFSGVGPNRNIEYITFSSLGDTIDFGDLTLNRSSAGAVSNGHGGLG